MAQELILTFHGLGEPPAAIGEAERRVWVPVEWFEALLDALPPHGVELAFDDGNASDVAHALPALTLRRRTARFFPLTGRIGTTGYLSAEQLLELHTAGMRIGSHGRHHRDWRALDDGELHAELTEPRATLAEITGEPVTEAACPFGSYDRRVLAALRAAGYARAFSSDGGSTAVGSWLAARTTVHRGRALSDWVALAAAGPGGPPSLAVVGKRWLKRLR